MLVPTMGIGIKESEDESAANGALSVFDFFVP